MKKILIRFFGSHPAIVFGGCLSLLLLGIFLAFQFFDSKMLNLETRWLLASGIPILIALFVGGYIKSFKGFGVELEARLEKPIPNESLIATEAMSEVTGDEKKTIGYLERLSPPERRAIERLVVVQGKRDYYSSYALECYFRELRALKYIEVQDANGRFIALLSMRVFRNGRRNQLNDNLLGEFIYTLESSEITSRYPKDCITLTISENEELLEALKLMRSKRIREIAVLDDEEKFVGLLMEKSIEKKIVDSVLQAKEQA